MPTVTLSIPKLGVTDKGWERNKEIYVLGFVIDGQETAQRGSERIAAYNETLPQIRKGLAKTNLGRVAFIAASNVFRRIRADQPVSLSGSGIILYPNLDPKGFLAAHFMVVESDHEKRALGKLLGDLVGPDSAIEKAAGELLPALGGPHISLPLGGVLRSLVEVVPSVLKENDDNPLFEHDHSGFDFDCYGLSRGPNPDESTMVEDFQIGNDRAFATLRVRVSWSSSEATTQSPSQTDRSEPDA